MRILMIDDTKSVHAYVSNLLIKASPSLSSNSVFNGQEALQYLAKNNQIDLILLDWEMPILNGPETLKKLKVSHPNIPVIMMTTKNKPEDIQMILELGASEYIMKPFTADILLEKIEQVTGWMVDHAS